MNIAVIILEKNKMQCDCVKAFQKHNRIDAIVVVADEKDQDMLDEWMEKEHISKLADYAPIGVIRQQSVYSGIAVAREVVGWYEVPDEIGGYIHVGAKEESEDIKDIVVIHDAAASEVSEKAITECINGALECDGAASSAGHTPEAYKLDQLLAVYDGLSDEELSDDIECGKLAEQHGMLIKKL